MRCLNPNTISNPNFGKWWLKNGHLSHIQVPCGKCYNCLSARRMEWLYRLRIESLFSLRSYFVTLTLDDEHIEDNVCKKSDLQNFFKRLRNQGYNFKYYAIGEYGSHFHRAHYHVLFFIQDEFSSVSFSDLVRKIWSKGLVQIGSVSPNSINYVLHYHVRPKIVDDKSTFSLMSKGLGLQQFTPQFLEWLDKQDNFKVCDIEGNKYIMPRYYRKKFGLKKDYEVLSVFDTIERVYDLHDSERVTQLLHDLQCVDKNKFRKYNEQEKF